MREQVSDLWKTISNYQTQVKNLEESQGEKAIAEFETKKAALEAKLEQEKAALAEKLEQEKAALEAKLEQEKAALATGNKNFTEGITAERLKHQFELDKVKKNLAIIAIHKWRLGLKSKKAAAPAATVTAPDPSPQPSYMLIDHHLTEKMYKTFGGPWIDEYINNNTQIEFGKIKEQINHLNLDGFKDWFDNTDINLFSQESNAHFFVDAYYACEIVKMIKSIKTNDTEIIGTILTGITTPEHLR